MYLPLHLNVQQSVSICQSHNNCTQHSHWPFGKVPSSFLSRTYRPTYQKIDGPTCQRLLTASDKLAEWHNSTTICFAIRGSGGGRTVASPQRAVESHKWAVATNPGFVALRMRAPSSAARHMLLYLRGGKRATLSPWFATQPVGTGLHPAKEKSCILLCNKFHSIYEQISLVNMTGNQQSLNICYYLLITRQCKFMAVDCWHIHMKTYLCSWQGTAWCCGRHHL